MSPCSSAQPLQRIRDDRAATSGRVAGRRTRCAGLAERAWVDRAHSYRADRDGFTHAASATPSIAAYWSVTRRSRVRRHYLYRTSHGRVLFGTAAPPDPGYHPGHPNMLHEFIAANREEIIDRCRAKVAMRSVPPPTKAEIEHGVPVFLDQLGDALAPRAGVEPGDRQSAIHARARPPASGIHRVTGRARLWRRLSVHHRTGGGNRRDHHARTTSAR